MAIKQRVMAKLRTAGNDLLHTMGRGKGKDLSAICQSLSEARDLCREGLPEKYYAAYGEIYDGMILAIRQMLDDGTTSPQDDVLLLCKELLQHITKETKNEDHFKKEMVFLPYKASMWDSLESVWKAAYEDKEHCNAYVIPIPYCDRNPDGSVARWYCERNLFPDDVPVLRWEDFDIEAMHPDVIFIHNPYDNGNLVTSVDSRYYSGNLKACTDLLIYSPYYIAFGGMGDGQTNCACYPNVDYIIVQSERIKSYFDQSVPRTKLIALGSPKLDRVIRLCKNPPEPPEQWKNRLKGKRVYFYNTGLVEMLSDPNAFLNKMQYVFQCFRGRQDVCLIWRPHPLMKATLSSMAGGVAPYYEKIKEMFLRENIGIYDDTPDIDRTIALSDAFIGDRRTSVGMLFGASGKSMFILNNNIHQLPSDGDWRGDIVNGVSFQEQDEWIVTPSNQLYHAHENSGIYMHICSLCEYHTDAYYLKAVEVDGKVYICPRSAQDILIVSDCGIEERIALERKTESGGNFVQAWRAGHYIFLIPCYYPAIVRYDTRTKKVAYIENMNHIFVKNLNGEWRVGGSCVWNGALLIASPDNSEVLHVDIETMETEVGRVGTPSVGCICMAADNDDIWLLPTNGYTVKLWQPLTGKVREYFVRPEGFQPKHYLQRYACDELPFGMPAFDKDYVYLPPWQGNQFVRLEKRSGNAEPWNIGLSPTNNWKNGYYAPYHIPYAMADFWRKTGEDHWRLFYSPDRKLYDVNVKTGSCEEVPILFDEDALSNEVSGFVEQSEWLRYGCMEDAFNALPTLLDGALPGNPHDRDRQIRNYREDAANCDGTAGEKIYQFAMKKLLVERGIS